MSLRNQTFEGLRWEAEEGNITYHQLTHDKTKNTHWATTTQIFVSDSANWGEKWLIPQAPKQIFLSSHQRLLNTQFKACRKILGLFSSGVESSQKNSKKPLQPLFFQTNSSRPNVPKIITFSISNTTIATCESKKYVIMNGERPPLKPTAERTLELKTSQAKTLAECWWSPHAPKIINFDRKFDIKTSPEGGKMNVKKGLIRNEALV